MSLSLLPVALPGRQGLSGRERRGRRRQMSSGHEVSGETLEGLSRDTKGDCEEIHFWERKKQGSQTHLREIMGDMGRSKDTR